MLSRHLRETHRRQQLLIQCLTSPHHHYLYAFSTIKTSNIYYRLILKSVLALFYLEFNKLHHKKAFEYNILKCKKKLKVFFFLISLSGFPLIWQNLNWQTFKERFLISSVSSDVSCDVFIEHL